jgi:plasmid maintenance system antidote protein VapI
MFTNSWNQWNSECKKERKGMEVDRCRKFTPTHSGLIYCLDSLHMWNGKRIMYHVLRSPFTVNRYSMSDNLIHPWRHLLQEIKNRGRTQKQFSAILGKKISELNELINGKRNITIQRDILLWAAFWDPEGKRIAMQNQYDFYRAKLTLDQAKISEIKRKTRSTDKEHIFHNF